MPVKLFSIRGLELDEILEIRRLLYDSRIDYFETPDGNAGFTEPAIWLKDNSQLVKAQYLISNYQADREKKAKIEYNDAVSSGKIKSLFQVAIENPSATIAFTIVFLIIIIGVAIKIVERL